MPISLREMIGFAAQRLMNLEFEGLTGAGYGEKSWERLVQREGYRSRGHRRAADPEAAQGSYFPVYLSARPKAEKVITVARRVRRVRRTNVAHDYQKKKSNSGGPLW